DGDNLSSVLVNGPLHGSVTLSSNGSFTYTPATNYHGSVSFTYSTTDGQRSATAVVSIKVDAPPAAADDSYNVGRNGAHVQPSLGLLTNDSDPDGDPLTVTV